MKKVIIVLILVAICLSAQESKRIYTGLRLGGGIGMVLPIDDDFMVYFGDKKDPNSKWRDGGSFDIAPFVSLQILDKFALQTEVMITRFGYYGGFYEYSEYGYTEIEQLQISRAALLFPILAKYTIRRNRFNFQLYAGPHFNANVGKYRRYEYFKSSGDGYNEEYEETTEYNDYKSVSPYPWIDRIKTPLMGYSLGTNFGFISTNAGTVFVDVRFLGDMGIVKQYLDGYIYEEGWWPYLYRMKLSISLGWEMGFVNR